MQEKKLAKNSKKVFGKVLIKHLGNAIDKMFIDEN
jgi:hypothetical protein